MKKLMHIVGGGIFWFLWPFWIMYFKFGGTRSRVLVVCGDEFLITQSWLDSNRYNIPGGGTKKHESVRAGAVRELKEELGLDIPESSLKYVGKKRHNQHKIRYTAEIFCVYLQEKPKLKLRKIEVADAQWVTFADIQNYKTNSEVAYALRRYKPLEQASLL